MSNGLFHSFNLREGNMALGQCYMKAPLGQAQAREAAQRRQVSLREEEGTGGSRWSTSRRTWGVGVGPGGEGYQARQHCQSCYG